MADGLRGRNAMRLSTNGWSGDTERNAGAFASPLARRHYPVHEMIVPSLCRAAAVPGLVLANKRVYICSLLAIAMLAASPMRGAEPAAGSGLVPASQKFVVRVDKRSGRLIRTVAPETPRTPAASAKKRAEFSGLVEQAARAHNVDPLLVDSVIQVESSYDPYAVSPKGAEGLMQLMPSTARMLGVSNSFDPQQNIEAGVRYLKQLKEIFKDDRLALAAYNAGPGAVEKLKWIPPYRETLSYVDEVGRRYDGAKKAAALQPPGPKPEESVVAPSEKVAQEKVEEKHPKLEQYVDEYGRLHLSTKRE
jgi:hypothetical protein